MTNSNNPGQSLHMSPAIYLSEVNMLDKKCWQRQVQKQCVVRWALEFPVLF